LRFKVDVDFDPAAEAPVYEQHINEVLKGNQRAIDTFDEFAGLTLIANMNFQKALYLVGPAGSGKSTLLHCIQLLHDPRAVSVTSLTRLDDERYRTEVARKLVCISHDTQSNRSIFGETFTQITGGDPVSVRPLYFEVETAIPTVRFIGSMNLYFPTSLSATDALERRLIFLRCGDKPAKIDPRRFDKLRSESSGILARYVRALKRLLERGEFLLPPESLEDVAEYLHDQDPFETFVAGELMKDPDNKLAITVITAEYNEWAKSFGARPLGLSPVGRKLRALGFEGGIMRSDGGTGPNQRFVYARLKRLPNSRLRDDM
jgi:putative DNA primase/helicase